MLSRYRDYTERGYISGRGFEDAIPVISYKLVTEVPGMIQ